MTLSPADRLDILDLLTRADAAASARDIEGYLRLLTRDALAAVWSAEPKASLHLTLNPVIDASGPPGRAVARSVLLIINPGPPPALAATARITQDLRQEDGQWKISRRTVST